jgi:hypothetical protein
MGRAYVGVGDVAATAGTDCNVGIVAENAIVNRKGNVEAALSQRGIGTTQRSLRVFELPECEQARKDKEYASPAPQARPRPRQISPPNFDDGFRRSEYRSWDIP